MGKLLYKYRGINNFQFLIDILVNKRLYACHYAMLNDPMEGIYYYNSRDGELLKNHMEEIKTVKNTLKICSLSKNRNNPLMWAHYAQEGKGINIGVQLKTENAEKVEYKKDSLIANLNFNIRDDNAAKIILKNKSNAWRYEKEMRVFTSKEYVDIIIKEIIFGTRTDEIIKDLIKNIAEKYNPGISFKKIKVDKVVNI